MAQWPPLNTPLIVKRLIRGRSNVTRVRFEPRSCDQGRRKNDAFTHFSMLPISINFSKRQIPQTDHKILIVQ